LTQKKTYEPGTGRQQEQTASSQDAEAPVALNIKRSAVVLVCCNTLLSKNVKVSIPKHHVLRTSEEVRAKFRST